MACNPEWASSPFTLLSSTGASKNKDILADHAVIKMAKQMALIHNTMLRGLSSVYNECLAIQPGTQDAADLLVRGQVFFEMLHEHNDAEEKEA
jgi:hypothetical protein